VPTKAKLIRPRRGGIYLVNFDLALGAEIKKSRLALVLQNDIANRYSPITIVAAITSKYDEKLYPTEALIEKPEGGLTRDAVVLLNQVRSIDKSRLIKRIGALKPATMHLVDRALQISVGLVKL
jgi:mRNA interferase MazF